MRYQSGYDDDEYYNHDYQDCKESEPDYSYVDTLNNQLKNIKNVFSHSALGYWSDMCFTLSNINDEFNEKLFNKKYVFYIPEYKQKFFVGTLSYRLDCDKDIWYTDLKKANSYHWFSSYIRIQLDDYKDFYVYHNNSHNIKMAEIHDTLVIKSQELTDNEIEICRILNIGASPWYSHGLKPKVNSIFYDNRKLSYKQPNSSNLIFCNPIPPYFVKNK